jgi:Tol biopolymer transport system component
MGAVNTQVYVWDFNTSTGVLVSRKAGGPINTPCNNRCSTPRISADGNFVAFDSNATDLSAVTAGFTNMPQTYRVVSTGTADALPVARDAAGVIADESSFLGNISADGRYIVFHSTNGALVNPPSVNFDIMVRKDFSAPNGPVDLVTDKPGFFPIPIFPNGYVPSVSADGVMVAFNSSDGTLAGGITLNHPQVFVRNMLTGKVFFCSRHKDGTPSNLDCEAPRISGDGKWVIWSTVGSTLVDGDTNGASDVYMRGPLR